MRSKTPEQSQEERFSSVPTTRSRGERQGEVPRTERTPSPRRTGNVPVASPGARSSNDEWFEVPEEALRVCVDVCNLMTCEHLKEGLRTEGLPTSGLKEDLNRRLGERLSTLMKSTSGPTIRQLRYVLWLWRSRDLSYKHSLRYHEIVDRNRISALIHFLKER